MKTYPSRNYGFDWDSLVGKTVKEVYLSPEKDYIKFIYTDDTCNTFYADGDCCSTTWIEHINGLTNLLYKEITKVENKYISGEYSNEYDYLQKYSLTISTTVGYFDIEYRNSSNGYYGGSLDPMDNCDEFATEKLLTDF